MNRALKEFDFSVVCGFRNEESQNYAYDNGFSKKRWPNSKHNVSPSIAVDVAPYPINWKDAVAFCQLAKIIKRIADELMIEVTWGGDWVHFPDLAHWELKYGGRDDES